MQSTLENTNSTPEPEDQQRFEGLQNIKQELSIAYHGVMAFIARRRMQHAGNLMEKMDHKDALYSDVGAFAMNGIRTESPTATGNPAMPINTLERHVARRAHKISRHRSEAITQKARANKVFGTREELPGMNKRERRITKMGLKRRQGGIGAAQDGQLLPGEYVKERTKVDATRLKFGEKEHIRRDVVLGRSERKLRRQGAVLGLSSRWHSLRRNNAISRIKKNYRSAEKHNAARNNLRVLRDEEPETPRYTPPTPPRNPAPTRPSTQPRTIVHAKGEVFGDDDTKKFDKEYFRSERKSIGAYDYDRAMSGKPQVSAEVAARESKTEA